MKNYLGIFTNGIVKENPLLVLMIGLCSSLAVTTQLVNGLGMGLAMTFVLVMSEIIISLFRKLIPASVRIPVFIVVIAAFTTIVDLAMKAYLPALSAAMGVFIPLIVVNCIIMGRVESFASKRTVGEAALDALGMGLGYLWVLCGISFVRELLGGGTVLKGITANTITVIPSDMTIQFFAGAAGGFFVFAMFIAVTMTVRSISGQKNADSPACC
ncbi:MAG: electron transport complex subunit E [Treponemataceae bacterium]|nr:MAG: electron transport complex subunit E [Treponemataceae bacterium]